MGSKKTTASNTTNITSGNTEEIFNKLIKTEWGKDVAGDYLNEQYKSGKITEDQVRKLASKLNR